MSVFLDIGSHLDCVFGPIASLQLQVHACLDTDRVCVYICTCSFQVQTPCIDKHTHMWEFRGFFVSLAVSLQCLLLQGVRERGKVTIRYLI